jgi:hypothetical protein
MSSDSAPENLPTLTAKQRAFVDAYVDCLNATEAARRAGYAQPMQQGHRLLRNVDIVPHVETALKERTLPKSEVLARLTAHARADIRDLFAFNEETGEWEGLNINRAAPLHLIRSITPTKYGTKIELHDQQAALIKLGEAYGIFRSPLADSMDAIAAAARSLDAKLMADLEPGATGGAAEQPDPDREGGAAV